MFTIDIAHYLATQEVLIQTRTLSLGAARRKGGTGVRRRKRGRRRLSLDPAEPDDDGRRRPGTGSALDSSLLATERLRVVELGGDEEEEGGWSGNEDEAEEEGPIVATPMGAVRPWPRGEGVNGNGDSMAGPEERSGGDDGLLSKGDGKTPMKSGESHPTIDDGQLSVFENDAGTHDSGFREAPIVETPMGIVRPTGFWRRRRWDRTAGGESSSSAVGGEPPVRNEEGGLRKPPTTGPGLGGVESQRSEGPIIKTPMGNLRPTRTGLGGLGTNRSGDGTTNPAEPSGRDGEKGSGSSEEQPTKTPADKSILGNGMMSAVFKDIVNRFLANSRRSTDPPPATDLLDNDRPLSTRSEKPATALNTTTNTNPTDLHNITTITLLTEDLRGLTAFYTTILGATLASATATSSTLAFTPHLTILVLDSTVARDRGAFGDDVTVGRHAGMPKRVLLGVEVRDVDAVWRRLRDAGHGLEGSDGQEALGEVRVVEGRRSVCFVDLAGHCWEAWQRVEGEGE